MIKISIIVPVYKTANYLKKCLDSLINQTLKEIEIIIVNDASPDNSLEIIKSYDDKRIKLINHDINQGIGRTRNDGLKIATGEYVAFVDSDDYIELNMYEKYYKYAKENALDIVTGYYSKIMNNVANIFKNDYFDICNYQNNHNIINLIDYGPCNKIFLRENIQNHNIKFEEKLKFEDMPFVLKNIYHAKSIGHIKEAYYNYCIRDKSETTTIDQRTGDIFKILDIANNYYKERTIELEYLNIREVTRYLLKQKYQKDKAFKKSFINNGYSYLNNIYPNWKNNKYYLKEPLIKRIIKNKKYLMQLYCML